MSGDIVDRPFRSAADKVKEDHQRSVDELRESVSKAKSEALKKVSP